jgi:hypothetical protein
MSQMARSPVTIDSSLCSDDDLSAQLLSTFDAVKAAMQPISRKGWRERYDTDLNGECYGVLWDWNGEPPDAPAIFKDT